MAVCSSPPKKLTAEPAGVRFTVYDPFAECFYCRRTFDEAQRDADKIGYGLILEVKADDILSPRCLLRRYRKEGGQWKPETLQPRPGGAKPTP